MNRVQAGLIVIFELVRPGHDPAGHGPDFRRRRCGSGGGRAETREVMPEVSRAAGVAAVTQFLPELGGVDAASVPAFAQVGLVLVPLLRDLRDRAGTRALNSAGIATYANSHRVRAGNRASSRLRANDPAV